MQKARLQELSSIGEKPDFSFIENTHCNSLKLKTKKLLLGVSLPYFVSIAKFDRFKYSLATISNLPVLLDTTDLQASNKEWQSRSY